MLDREHVARNQVMLGHPPSNKWSTCAGLKKTKLFWVELNLQKNHISALSIVSVYNKLLKLGKDSICLACIVRLGSLVNRYILCKISPFFYLIDFHFDLWLYFCIMEWYKINGVHIWIIKKKMKCANNIGRSWSINDCLIYILPSTDNCFDTVDDITLCLHLL